MKVLPHRIGLIALPFGEEWSVATYLLGNSVTARFKKSKATIVKDAYRIFGEQGSFSPSNSSTTVAALF